MKKKIKKAFTLVELLVVIAILAILATVSIVGYNSFTKKARVSNDTVLVKQMNDILFANSQTDDKNPTMTKALEDVFDGGYDLTKLTPTTTGYSIVWDSKNDQMVLLDDSSNKAPVYPEASKVSEKKDLFIITRNKTEFGSTSEFAHYLAESFEGSDIETSTGIDTGRNENVKSVKYSNSSKQDAIIRTNSGTLTINASNDNVYHYGLADKVIIENVAAKSYHENGYVTSYLEVKNGHVVLEKNSSVSILAVNGSDVTVDQNANSELFKVVPVGDNEIKNVNVIDKSVISTTKVNTNTLEKMKYGGGTGDDGAPYELYTASHLAAFAKDVNSGNLGNYVYAKLCKDVDISGMGWEPIGNVEHPFVGSFDGGKHTISGLTNKGYSPAASLWGMTANSKNSGTAYGFFGVIGVKDGDGKDKEIILKDIKFTNVNINIDDANMLGVLVGADTGAAKIKDAYVNKLANYDITISGVNASGKMVSNNSATVGGIVGKIYTNSCNNRDSNHGILVIKECESNLDITITNDGENKIGGLLGYTQTKAVNIMSSTSNSSIFIQKGTAYVGGLVSYIDGGNKLYLSDCKVTKSITFNDSNSILGASLLIGHRKPYIEQNVSSKLIVNNQEIAINQNQEYKNEIIECNESTIPEENKH